MKLSRIYNELVTVEWRDNKDKRCSVHSADVVLNHFGDETDIRGIDYKKVMGFIDALRNKDYTGSTINRRLSALSMNVHCRQAPCPPHPAA